MKSVKYLLEKPIFILFVAFVSCQIEEIHATINPDQNITSSSFIFDLLGKTSNNDTIECINFVYPLLFSTYDSNSLVLSTKTIDNDNELKMLLNTTSNSDFNISFIALKYPVRFVTSNNTTATAYNNKELIDALIASDETCVNIDNLFACIFDFFELDFIIVDTDNPNDGITSFSIDIDLDCNGLDYDLTYFERLSDAHENMNKIVFPYTNTISQQKLYARAATNYFNETYNEVFEVHLNVNAQMANTVCPADYTNYFLKQCKWHITDFTGNTNYSDYEITFKDYRTFIVKNTIENSTTDGIWTATSSGAETTINVGFNATNELTQLSGDWNVKTCNLNKDTAAFAIEFASENFNLTIDCI